MKNRRKKNILFIVILLVAFLGIGYAYLTTTLSINGVTDVDRNSWDVYFDNVQVESGSVTGEQVIEAPTITSDTEVEFHIRLKEPGDFYAFTIDAKNDGTIDAMINSISKTINNETTLPVYLNYTVTYEDDETIEDNHLLAAGSLETYKVRVEYRTDINPSDLPSASQSLTLSFDVEYVQADENATGIGTKKFTFYNSLIKIGDTIPAEANAQDDYQSLIEGPWPYFNKFYLRNGKVVSSYVGFTIHDKVYYLRGGGATYNEQLNSYNYDSSYYNSNRQILLQSFGKENCNEYVYDAEYNNETYTQCYYGDENTVLYGDVSKNGSVSIGGGVMQCYSNGDAHCIRLG